MNKKVGSNFQGEKERNLNDVSENDDGDGQDCALSNHWHNFEYYENGIQPN